MFATKTFCKKYLIHCLACCIQTFEKQSLCTDICSIRNILLNLSCCEEESIPCFRETWRWQNDDRIVISRSFIPRMCLVCYSASAFLTGFSPEFPPSSSLALNTLSEVPILGVEIEIPTTVIWLYLHAVIWICLQTEIWLLSHSGFRGNFGGRIGTNLSRLKQ